MVRLVVLGSPMGELLVAQYCQLEICSPEEIPAESKDCTEVACIWLP